MNQNFNPQLLTILVPVYNEAETVEAFLLRVEPVIARIEKEHSMQVELIFTDNASEDGTFEKVVKLSSSRTNLKIYRFSKNFGFQRSIISGYSLSKGAACVQIDCDLEDPPELILEFVNLWKRGYKIVYGKRRRREERMLMHLTRSAFYKVVNLLSENYVPEHAGDFRLIDRRVIDIVCSVNDAEPYLRGLIASLGFEQIGVEYDRSARVAGASSFNLRSYASIATEGILQSSIRPLNFALYGSLLAMLISFLLAIYYLYGAIWGEYPPEARGFATIVVLGLFQFSFLLLVIGINSLYLGRVYRQVFKRPISIIQSTNQKEELVDDKLVYWPAKPYKLDEHEEPLKGKSYRGKQKASNKSG